MRGKLQYNLICPYCNKTCDSDKDEFVISRRNTKTYFHFSCYMKNREVKSNDRNK